MRRPAVFFDRDNTLIVGNDYLGDPNGVTLVAGAPAAVATCRTLGYAVVVVSNQSGVARGMFTETDVAAVNRRTDELLIAANPAAVVDRHEYCPHHPDGAADGYAVECDCRKPKPGMVLRAAEAMALDLPASWMVGDAPRDVAAGRAAGCRTILIIDRTLAPSPAAREPSTVAADFVVGSLVEAIDVILQETNRPNVPASTIPELPQAVTIVAGPPPESPPTVVAAPKPSESPAPLNLARLEMLSQQILMELKKLNDIRHDDFSISKLVAGITQTLALAAWPLAYVLYRQDPMVFQSWLLTAVFLQVFTVALLIMGRQR